MFSPDPKPGDLIEIRRNFYSHWAICIKNEEVIHLTTGGTSSSNSFGLSSSTEIAEIKRESLAKVTGGSPYHINNNTDSMWKPLPIDRILETAKAMVGRKMHYSVTEANCEHFVHLLRYGRKKSDQASKVSTITSFIPGAMLLNSIFEGYYTEKVQPVSTMEDEYKSALPYSYLKRGYLIRISQLRNEYWALYVGSGEIIYPCKENMFNRFRLWFRFGSPTLANEAPSGYVIRRERLAEVATSDRWKVDNCWDDRMEPLPKDKIIKNAKAMVQHKIKRNAKDFVKLIRYFETPDSDPEPGDAITILRPRFNQWAIYVGVEDIIYPDSGHVVVRNPLVQVASSDLWCVNNKLDSSMEPLCAEDIIKNAKAMVGQKVELSKEDDFIRHVRYGKKR